MLPLIQSNTNKAYVALQSYVTSPTNIRVPGIVHTERAHLSREQIAARYLRSVEGNPDIDINKANTPEQNKAPRVFQKVPGRTTQPDSPDHDSLESVTEEWTQAKLRSRELLDDEAPAPAPASENDQGSTSLLLYIVSGIGYGLGASLGAAAVGLLCYGLGVRCRNTRANANASSTTSIQQTGLNNSPHKKNHPPKGAPKAANSHYGEASSSELADVAASTAQGEAAQPVRSANHQVNAKNIAVNNAPGRSVKIPAWTLDTPSPFAEDSSEGNLTDADSSDAVVVDIPDSTNDHA